MKVCFNGEFHPSHLPLLTAQNRSYKWGDGLFETMKLCQGKLLLEQFHFERMFISLRLLQINISENFRQEVLVQKILELCTLNNCDSSARIRLSVYRNDDDSSGYLIEATPHDEKLNAWQEAGLTVCLYPHARKSTDAFANIKSANFLPYVLAKKYADEKRVDDAIVLNAHNYVCDTSKANIFLVKANVLYTPALHQGCVSGVMRRTVIEETKKMGYRLVQQEISKDDLAAADEVFLTNAIQNIRWVKSFNESSYVYTETKKIFTAVQEAITKPLIRK